jgi:hypothetical protein
VRGFGALPFRLKLSRLRTKLIIRFFPLRTKLIIRFDRLRRGLPFRLKLSLLRTKLIIQIYRLRLGIQDRYLRLLERPQLTIAWCGILGVAFVIAVPILAVFFGETFWKLFDHVAAALALLGLLLAFPALAYAISTERGIRGVLRITGARLEHLSSPTSAIVMRASDPALAKAIETLGLPEESPEEVLHRFAVESAIEAGAESKAVRELLRKSEVFVIGETAGDTSIPGHGTESNILHFTIDDADGRERTMMPVFTRSDALESAVRRNPDWQDLSVLEVNGGGLLANRDSDVT